MIKISDILTPEHVYSGASLKSKKKILEFAAEMISMASPNLSSEEIFEALCHRERLGSTVLGYGVALPHIRLPKLEAALGLLLRLRESVTFDGEDNDPVDLLFILAVPEASTDMHLDLLRQIAEKFSRADFRDHLREAPTSDVMYELTTT